MICPCCGKPKRPEGLDGFGTALKPAMELIALARKPLSERTIAANVLRWGTGALNVDGCRIVAADGDEPLKWETPRGGIWKTDTQSQSQAQSQVLGRWPANVITDGSDEVVAAFPAEAGGYDKRVGMPPGMRPPGFGNVGHDRGDDRPNGPLYGDVGSAARFFYSAKADSDDRLGSKHPTVKPLDLMQYLVRLVTRRGGVVLDPFAGTGTTGEAAWREGMRAILIEREAEYQADIRRRMDLALSGPETRARAAMKERMKNKPQDHGPLFGGSETTPGGADRFTESSPTKHRPDRIEVVSE